MDTHVKSAFSLLLNEEKHIILVKRKDIPFWDLPGGNVEAEETPKEAAMREAVEETGYTVSLDTFNGTYSRKKRSDCQFIFLGRIENGQSIADSAEVKEKRAFSPDCLPLNLIPERSLQISDWLQGKNNVKTRLNSSFLFCYLQHLQHIFLTKRRQNPVFTYIPASEAQLEDLVAIYQSNAAYFSLLDQEPSRKQVFIDMEERPPKFPSENKYFYLVTDETNQPIGVLDLLLGYPTKETAYIGLLLIGPRGQGIGSRLIADIEKRCREQQMNAIELGVLRSNSRGLKFWQTNKFELLSTVEVMINETLHLVHRLKKEL